MVVSEKKQMNIYLYDQHREVILDVFSIPNTNNIGIIENILNWLEERSITNEYKKLVIAKSYVKKYDEESGLTTIEFQF